MTNVVTRFAPSPTGYLHIGGARTALFNWLYSRANNGKMLLRIEDTDRARYNEVAVEAIKDGLSWLGLDWDGEPASQFERSDRHREVVKQLLSKGAAYRCYATPEELTEMREKAKAEGRPPRYDGRWRDRDASEAPKDQPSVIRIKAPREGEILVEDQVQGLVRFPAKDMDDFIILRSDGTPTYMHAVVADDHDMGVTHVIRGDDHLTNAARQTIIYQAMGWKVPVMAHIPLIHGSDGAKLSKRHGAIGVEAYRAMGYLPEALRNYLVRLGWAHGDDEIMSTEEMTKWFDFEGMNKAAARFDFAKLENLNGHYIRHAEDEHLVKSLESVLHEIDGGELLKNNMTAKRRNQLAEAMPGLKERAKTLIDLANGAAFLFSERPLQLDEKATSILDDDARKSLGGIIPLLKDVSDWNLETVEATVRQYTEQQGLKLGRVAQPLRAALTGRGVSPGVFDVLSVLGREESIARIEDQLTK